MKQKLRQKLLTEDMQDKVFAAAYSAHFFHGGRDAKEAIKFAKKAVKELVHCVEHSLPE